MADQLSQLRVMTKVVADTGDIDAIKRYKPFDATTNPSLILKEAQSDSGNFLLKNAILYGKKIESNNQDLQINHACDWLTVHIGHEIQKMIPGVISTEVDARLSFDTEATLSKARHLINLYAQAGADTKRVLIKIAATWEGIKAAEILKKEGIQCNLTLLFSMIQAQACAASGVYLISPFVGRILDWHRKNTGKEYTSLTDPGVLSVQRIFYYYKKYNIKTVVMGASFRNVGEITSLSGCDCLTISPTLLDVLSTSNEQLDQMLSVDALPQIIEPELIPNEKQFRWAMNENAMATEKLAEGIRGFTRDQRLLENMMKEYL